jgi:fatty acid desaturase
VKREITKEYVLLGLILLTILVLVPWTIVWKIWVIPFLIACAFANIRGLSEHGMTTGGNEFVLGRTVVSNKFVSYFMCNLNYHIEHHLFPRVPWYNLQKLHKILLPYFESAGASVYPGYSRFLYDFFRQASKEYVPNKRLIPRGLLRRTCV